MLKTKEKCSCCLGFILLYFYNWYYTHTHTYIYIYIYRPQPWLTIHCSCIVLIQENKPTGRNNNYLLVIWISSTCFRRWFSPSSGALDCVYSLWYNAPKKLPAGDEAEVEQSYTTVPEMHGHINTKCTVLTLHFLIHCLFMDSWKPQLVARFMATKHPFDGYNSFIVLVWIIIITSIPPG